MRSAVALRWIDAHQAGAILGLSRTRTKELIQSHKLLTKEELRGRARVRLVDAAAVHRLKLELRPAIDVGERQAVALKPPRQVLASGSGASLAVAMAELARSLAAIARGERLLLGMPDAKRPKLPVRDHDDGFQWVTLREAVKITRLRLSTLRQFVESGRLPSLQDGKRLMIKMSDLQELSVFQKRK